MTELEKPSVILRREALKPEPNWTREELYEELPVNGHTEQCRCQLAIIQDYLVGKGAIASAYRHSDLAARAVANAYGHDLQVFISAIHLNDSYTDPEQMQIMRAAYGQVGYGSKRSPEIYRAFQAIAPKKLREIADHYEKHGL